MSVNPGRWTAQLDGDFVVFLIGAAVHDPKAASETTALLAAMVEMLAELEVDPSTGLLGYQVYGDLDGLIVQYWRSFDALEAYARNPDAKHAPVWRAWNQLAEDSRASAGIWHETFRVNGYEAMYGNMPTMGLQKAGTPVTIAEAKQTARQRITR